MKTFLQGLAGAVVGSICLGGILGIGGAIVMKKWEEQEEASAAYKIEQIDERTKQMETWLSTQAGYIHRILDKVE